MSAEACVVHEIEGVGVVYDPDTALQPLTASQFRPKSSFFLSQPYIPPSHEVDSVNEPERKVQRQQKRRKKWALHPDATDPALESLLNSAYTKLIEGCTKVKPTTKDLLSGGTNSAPQNRNAQGPGAGVLLEDMLHDDASERKEDSTCSNVSHEFRAEANVTPDRLRGCLVSNLHGRERLVDFGGEPFVVPSDSAFFLGDITAGMAAVTQALPRALFSQIVVDPPWPSQSRGKYYPTLPLDALKALPISALLHPRGLVALWVTNNRKLLAFVEEELLPAWGLQRRATWWWLKVTCTGQLVSPLASPHKKPFERVLIASRRPPPSDSTSPPHPSFDPASPLHSPPERTDAPGAGAPHNVVSAAAPRESQAGPSSRGEGLEGAGSEGVAAADQLAIVSQPAQHSRKPFLAPLLARWAPPRPAAGGAVGLELFARELHCGWVSVGDEALLFQHASLQHASLQHGPRDASGGAECPAATAASSRRAGEVMGEPLGETGL